MGGALRIYKSGLEHPAERRSEDSSRQQHHPPPSSADKMQRLCAHALILVLALAAFCEASWKPHSLLQDAPVASGANRGQEPLRMDRLGPASHPRRQLGLQDPPHMVAGRSC